MKRQPLDVIAIFPEIREIKNPNLRDGVVRVWQRVWKECAWERIEDVPVSGTIAYSHIRHNRAVVQVALAMARVFQEIHHTPVDVDLLLAAALLQDVSKLVEYAPGPEGTPRRTELGQKLGHATYAAHVALDEGLPLDLVHIILSHSPGSSFPWRNIEVKLLYYADQADVAALGGDTFQKKVIQFQ